MMRRNLREGLIIQRLCGIGSSFRTQNSDAASKRRVLSLARKNLHFKQARLTPDPSCNCARVVNRVGIRPESPLRENVAKPLAQFYKHCANAVEIFKNRRMDHLKEKLQEKARVNKLIKKRGESTKRTIIGYNKSLFYKTQFQVNNLFFNKIKLNPSHNKVLTSQPPRVNMNLSQSPIKDYSFKCNTTALINMYQPARNLQSQDNSHTLKISLIEAGVQNETLGRNLEVAFNCTERTDLYKQKVREIQRKILAKKNRGGLKTIAQEAKTPRRCHHTKRIAFTPRPNCETLPLVIINFEGVLGDVSLNNLSEISYYIKFRNTVDNSIELNVGLNQLMSFSRVVLHFSIPSKLFKVFRSYLTKSKAAVDAIYKSNTCHTFCQDYSQILLDFHVGSYESLGKRVLFVNSLDLPCDAEAVEFMDKQLANPDVGTLCRKVPVIYAIEKLAAKHNVLFNASYNGYYEPITLLVPSIQSQKKNKAFSMASLVKAISALSFDTRCADFLKGVNEYAYKSDAMFSITESEIFWKKFAELKEEKAMHISRLNDLTSTSERAEIEPYSNSDPAVTFIYLQLVELNSKQQETLNKSVEIDVSFSDEEFDEDAKAASTQSHVNIFAVPNLKFFENSVLECIRTEPSALHKRLFI
eukprot:TRINITY_DN1227_c0_g11_i1.p1 TRINITY_DN1227_c0_g11~~TRINITY_DN1227_c0_g11_i1.p1  ORF type:complete len:641 (+),score=88.26 TRINITY_DN1227_c0_g11_i1:75-1997(+)